nr:hypothetical protein [Flavobacterium lacisediminis]
MILTVLIRKTNFYNSILSNLNFVKSDKTNKIIGVGIVKWIVKNTFFKFLNQKLKFERKINISEVKNIRNEMTKAEIDHLFAFIFVLIIVIYELFYQKYLLAFIMLIVNIVMNLFPSLLQQQNKRRIDKLIFKFENKDKKIKH